MLLSEIKEREYRFKLALKIGLPIFSFLLFFISSTLVNTYESLEFTFYFTAMLLLFFSIYFIFFLIYKGFDEKITQAVTKTFTREYLYTFLKPKLKNDYTLMLLSIDNLEDINTRYGIKNGDTILYEVIQYISKYLENKNINNFPIGHIKGGDFIIGLEGKKEDYSSILELFCLKSSELKINEIEVNIFGAIIDTGFSNNLDYMIENLLEMKEENKNKKYLSQQEKMNPNIMESEIIKAIKEERTVSMTQNVYEGETLVMKECFNRLQDSKGKTLHPKSYMKTVSKLGLTAEYDYLMLKKSITGYEYVDDISYCINIDPTSLRNSTFLEKVNMLLDAYGEVQGKIVFIISESQYYSHIQRYNFTLEILRKKGVKIALDKLGSLHTSFLYLKDLDIDIVRFDGAYAKEENKSILKGLNTMGQDKGMKTWLKMVENEDSNNYANEIGVDYKQGNILSEITTGK